mmetsp:Transcript_27030/g.37981  ORF Transcript_27030/g.37981 Transcript_27030/m.37981 type:complete len:91 (-) Transcript_27030:7-279(-)
MALSAVARESSLAPAQVHGSHHQVAASERRVVQGQNVKNPNHVPVETRLLPEVAYWPSSFAMAKWKSHCVAQLATTYEETVPGQERPLEA